MRGERGERERERREREKREREERERRERERRERERRERERREREREKREREKRERREREREVGGGGVILCSFFLRFLVLVLPLVVEGDFFLGFFFSGVVSSADVGVVRVYCACAGEACSNIRAGCWR